MLAMSLLPISYPKSQYLTVLWLEGAGRRWAGDAPTPYACS